MWIEALNLAGVPATSKWRKADNVYYSSDICEAPTALPPLAAPTNTTFEQPLTTQVPLPPPKTSKCPSRASDQGQGEEMAKGKRLGQGVSQPEDKGKGKDKGKKAKPHGQRC